jgi:peptide deformylase
MRGWRRPGADEVRLLTDPVAGEPALRRAARPVTDFDRSLRRLVERMFAVMAQAHGVGLAANQIGSDASVFVLDCDGVRAAVVNPELTIPDRAPRFTAVEGCLSLPGRTYPTQRAGRAVVTGRDPRGRDLRLEGDGLLARCLQHESDHLAGVVFLDRLRGAVAQRASDELGLTVVPGNSPAPP